MTAEQPLEPIALTTPLYYVNAMPHIGSAYPTMAADALARFYRLRGNPMLFVTGTDEHGQKIQDSATKQGRQPQEHCDLIVAEFQNLWQKLNISYDRFSRTTNPRHESIVREFFDRVYQADDIYLDRQQGWYCVACEEFKEERELLPDHHCPIHKSACDWRDEPNYFFRLSKYQDRLEQLYRDHPDFIQPEIRRNEVLGFVKQGLRDFSISRVNVDWGFPVPTDPSHTLYVWFDALLGYVTGLLEPNDEPTLANAIKTWFPFKLHIIGKDILRFHAVYWPAMLMSADLPLPAKVFGHGFLTKDGHKMGKSLGNTIDPFDLVDRYGADAIRYYFLKEIEFGRDGDFNEERFINTVNADLANSLGNLLSRSIGMAVKYCQKQVPAPTTNKLADLTQPIVDMASDLGDRTSLAYEQLAFRQVCEQILTLVWSCNKLIDETAPWLLFKDGKHEEISETLYVVLEATRLSAYLLWPIIPTISQKIYQQLGFELDSQSLPPWQQHTAWGSLAPQTRLTKPKPVFQRLELATR
ncbi:methionyl-tRNA synthetase [Thalassoporum mexicanum PCC 7367]|uniref:methionine--tRNA ligase n=1 Tax=Thalassoporum mexicanum TaxID=3457544 RepID=UPI00029FCD28|nr:methionine--tRNA ligase [Pseudanabaena sp. PCC 7367]AFY70908.1 methionyl-tRNA synthetase [Pseudanabaena sp. PCC 7367]